MCDWINSNGINGSNANDYIDKTSIVSQIKPFSDKLLNSLETTSNGLTNGCPKSWEKSSVVTEKGAKSKGIVVSIESIESPTIDEVLDKVPLVYDPITKQLLLQRGFGNNNGLNGYKNGVNLHTNGFKKLNGVSNLIHENSSHGSNDKTIACEQYSTRNCSANNSVDNCFDDYLKALDERNDYSVVDCKQSPNKDVLCERRTVSQFNDNNALSLLDSNKDHSLEETTDGEYNGNNLREYNGNNNSDDNISNVDSSVLSLNLDDTESNCGSVFDSKPKKLFTLSLQSLLNKVKRNHNNNNISNNNSSVSNNSVNISSTTALILETRPPHLPAKPIHEDKQHKLEYEEMIRQSRKKEMKEMKARKKLSEKQRKQEQQVIEAIKVWNSDILPNWQKSKNCKKTRDQWWCGIPSHVRQRVWTLAIDNELNITEDIYRQCVIGSKDNIWAKHSVHCLEDEDCCGESAADLIKLDVSRTFPQLGLFQESGPYHEVLSELLGAYVTYRPDIGYAQGMSFLAAMLLLNMESEPAFVCLANLLNRQLLVSFFRVNQTVMNAYYKTYEEFFKENLPKLYKHFNEQKLSPDLYLVDYIYTLFSRSLPLDIASRIWDLFLRDGEEFIFRAALGILSMYYEVLLNLDFIYLAQFLTKLPEDIDSDKLFSYISGIHMTTGAEKTPFSDVLSTKLLENNNL
ncbi:unnamed protein product [Medioppia subpectinata]|uniref:Rab-GAP TBC domain-containing protein n=1 Tax=Medioppia subpectinata TaxID=1979941 RepID=A0A7R9KY55_9ACAR|nr:unnamed protein product [Medioppia subpectinata]CAG2110726.1 unnamed protein product [Medioppia subpectinata]